MSDTPTTPTPQVQTDLQGPLFSDNSSESTTYSVLTADRALRSLNIHLKNDKLLEAIKDPNNPYFQLLRVPMQNVFNGIILQQATDYQIYSQKLFVDYLLSGEGNKDENSPGADARDQLEQHRLELVSMGESFAALELEHKKLISSSQGYLKESAKSIKSTLELPSEIKNEIEEYVFKALKIKSELCDFRNDFYALILKVTDLLNSLPDFHMDEQRVEENRKPLHFNAKLGLEG